MSCEIVFLHNFYQIFVFSIVLQTTPHHTPSIASTSRPSDTILCCDQLHGHDLKNVETFVFQFVADWRFNTEQFRCADFCLSSPTSYALSRRPPHARNPIHIAHHHMQSIKPSQKQSCTIHFSIHYHPSNLPHSPQVAVTLPD